MECTGKEYESRLRQQHSKLNPRTAWATQHLHKRRKHEHGFGEDDSDEDQ